MKNQKRKKGSGGARIGSGRSKGRTKEQLMINIPAGTSEKLGKDVAKKIAQNAILSVLL